jgi:peptide/nickel transport system substrate-binding protein
MSAPALRFALAGLLAFALLPGARAQPHGLIEPPFLEERVAKGELPPIAERLPKTPIVVDLEDRKREVGRYGGDIRTLVAKPRDLRYLTVNGYTRLVGYDETLALKPDLLEQVDNEGDRVFTFTLREGHRWSDGEPFTTEDFRYFWEDVAENHELSPAGPPDFMIVDGVPAKVEILDDRHIRYSWDKPNPRFLPALAMPRPTFIYSPAHYLKQFHTKYADPDKLAKLAAKKKLTSWAALHNKLDDPYEASNVDMPVLDPWHVVTKAPAQRFIFERNPFYHRVDEAGHQLPYVDRLVVDVAGASLFAAKANAGEVDLLVRGLTTNDVPVLKQGEASHEYKTLLWPVARGSAFALYPNQNTNDPVWQALMRDVRFRRALSLAIDRRTLNNALWFGLGQEGNNTVRPESALYEERDRMAWAHYDPERAGKLLDEIGLSQKDGAGLRLLPDGRPMEILVEVDGESAELIDALQITAEFWADIGIKLLVKPQEASNLRQRSFAGQTLMVAAQGLDNALPTALMPPSELAPTRQDNPAWPQWGQYYETAGKAGAKPDGPGMDELMRLYDAWLHSSELTDKARIWADLLRLNAENQYTIGTVAGSIQPLVVSRHLRNVPTKAIYSWEPTAMLGAYRVDEFFYDNQPASGPSQ